MKQTGTEKFGSSGYPRFNVVLLIYFVLLKIINLFIIWSIMWRYKVGTLSELLATFSIKIQPSVVIRFVSTSFFSWNGQFEFLNSHNWNNWDLKLKLDGLKTTGASIEIDWISRGLFRKPIAIEFKFPFNQLIENESEMNWNVTLNWNHRRNLFKLNSVLSKTKQKCSKKELKLQFQSVNQISIKLSIIQLEANNFMPIESLSVQ